MMPNRLADELSPYLRKHAENPVDWYPWSDEAFELARQTGKPVFVSIGYTTCHWCNVMEEESFSDPAVGKLLNDSFVNIKVDREERPDVDAVYMAACQTLNNGRGGWPLSVFLDHERRPFFAGTYFPKKSVDGRIGLMDLVSRIRYLWLNSYDSLLRSSAELTQAIGSTPKAPADSASKEAAPSSTRLAASVFDYLEAAYDVDKGGFGPAPKFPTPHALMFLMRHARKTGQEGTLMMALDTLRAMRRGGIYDHLAGGVHRYSTDDSWLVPHFEKMLYDQALLSMAYAEAWQVSGDEEFARVAREMLDCTLRDFSSAGGGFHSAWGADSTGPDGRMQEGAFYLWTHDAIKDTLGTQADNFINAFNVRPEGNFPNPAANNGGSLGQNILHLSPDMELPEGELMDCIVKLHEARKQRHLPELDDKVLTDCNGLIIAALASSGRALGESRYIDAASRAASFVLKELRPNGRLMHRWHGGHGGQQSGSPASAKQVAVDANADDYAFMAWGLLQLHQATRRQVWLDEAVALLDELIDGFLDPQEGGFWFTHARSKDLPVRRKEIYDGATPSANSVALSCLIKVGRLTGRKDMQEVGHGIITAMGHRVEATPSAHTMLAIGALLHQGPVTEVTIEGRPDADDTHALLDALDRTFLPETVVRFNEKNSQARALVCSGSECQPPVQSPSHMLQHLD